MLLGWTSGIPAPHLHCTATYVQAQLDDIEAQHEQAGAKYSEDEDGLIAASDHVAMVSCGAGTLRINEGTSDVECTANFGTAMGSAGAIKGKWMCAAHTLGACLHCAVSSPRACLVAGAMRSCTCSL
jgi:hypothetical protein